jgi:hypothetical protein
MVKVDKLPVDLYSYSKNKDALVQGKLQLDMQPFI